MRYSDWRRFSRSCFRSLNCERVQVRSDRFSQQNKIAFPSCAPDHGGRLSSGDGIAGWPPGRPQTASSPSGSAHCRGLQHAPGRSTGRPTSYGICPWASARPVLDRTALDRLSPCTRSPGSEKDRKEEIHLLASSGLIS
jgi:hypothetical protein